MAYYTETGTIPKKRHPVPSPGRALYSEEVFGTEGFVGPTLHPLPHPPAHPGDRVEDLYRTARVRGTGSDARHLVSKGCPSTATR